MPLRHLTILVTRPAHQAKSLCAKLQKLGAHVIQMPTIEIKPISKQDELKTIITHLSDYDIAIFVSANAVRAVATYLQKPSTHTHIIPIGTGTAKVLREHGIRVDLIPDEFNSHGLLAMPILKHPKDKNMVIFCGENSKPTLSTTLVKRGAFVTQAICYRRVKPQVDLQATLSQLKQTHIDLIISTSNESLMNLIALFDNADTWLQAQQFLVISAKMAEKMVSLAIQKPALVAANATDEAILEKLVENIE